MSESQIPQTIDGFNSYIINTNTYMLAGTPTNGTRLGWAPAKTTQSTRAAFYHNSRNGRPR